MRAMTSAAMSYATNGYEVILDFSIPPWFIPTALAVAKFKHVPLDYVVLRPSEAICAARAAARPQGAIADYSQYSALYAHFDGENVVNDEESAAKVALKLRKRLDAGDFRIS